MEIKLRGLIHNENKKYSGNDFQELGRREGRGTVKAACTFVAAVSPCRAAGTVTRCHYKNPIQVNT